MPTVTTGLYGNPLDQSNVSLEHLKPHSKGGKSILSNFALADKDANAARGSKPLADFLDKEMLESYLAQFNFTIPGKFDGFQYQESVRQTCNSLGIPDKLPDLPKPSKSIKLPKRPEGKMIDYGNMKEVIANLDCINFSLLPKKVLKSLKHKGLLRLHNLNLVEMVGVEPTSKTSFVIIVIQVFD